MIPKNIKTIGKVLLILIGVLLINKAIELIGTITEDGPYYGIPLNDSNDVAIYFDRMSYKNRSIEAVKFENYEFPVLRFKKLNKTYQIIGLKELVSHRLYKNYTFQEIKFLYIEKWLTNDLIYFSINWDGYHETGYLFVSKFGYFKKYYIVWNW